MRADTPQPSAVTIYKQASGGFTVVVAGGASADHLTWDEMMGEVARLTMPGYVGGPRYLRTPEQADAARERRAARALERR